MTTFNQSHALLQIERVFFVAFLALLVLAPIPQGSNRIWATGLLGMALGSLLILAWVFMLMRGQSPLQRCLMAKVPLLALCGFCMLVWLQLFGGVPDPDAPKQSAFQALFQTADAYQTRRYLLSAASYLSAFVLVLLLVGSQRRARIMVYTLVAAGLFQALLAIWLLSTRASYLSFFESITHGTQATGTFINRNHLACYLYLCLSLGLGWILGSFTGGQGLVGTAAQRIQAGALALLRFMLSPRMALRLLLVVMVIALVLTRSRMGNLSFVMGMLALAALLWLRVPTLRRTVAIVVVSLLMVDVVIIGQWVGLERVIQRMEATAVVEEDRRGEETIEARLQPAWRTLPMIAEQPLFGHGGGSYYTAFPAHKTGDMLLHLLYFDHAHNDYVEIAADVGLVGLALLLAVALASARRAWQLASAQEASSTRGVAYGVWMAVVCVGVHSWVDFNLHIPANALTFTALLAMVWAAPWGHLRTPHAPHIKVPVRRKKTLLDLA